MRGPAAAAAGCPAPAARALLPADGGGRHPRLPSRHPRVARPRPTPPADAAIAAVAAVAAATGGPRLWRAPRGSRRRGAVLRRRGAAGWWLGLRARACGGFLYRRLIDQGNERCVQEGGEGSRRHPPQVSLRLPPVAARHGGPDARLCAGCLLLLAARPPAGTVSAVWCLPHARQCSPPVPLRRHAVGVAPQGRWRW